MFNKKKVKNYVCTLDQAKKLFDLGIEQDSLYHWLGKDIVSLNNDYSNGSLDKGCFSAFTSQELSELLISLNIRYKNNPGVDVSTINLCDCNAQTLARFLIYFLENEKNV